MKTLYIIDPTARQYGFLINDGLTVKIGDKKHVILGEEEDIELFHTAIVENKSFIIYGDNNYATFSASKITGVKIVNEK